MCYKLCINYTGTLLRICPVIFRNLAIAISKLLKTWRKWRKSCNFYTRRVWLRCKVTCTVEDYCEQKLDLPPRVFPVTLLWTGCSRSSTPPHYSLSRQSDRHWLCVGADQVPSVRLGAVTTRPSWRDDGSVSYTAVLRVLLRRISPRNTDQAADIKGRYHFRSSKTTSLILSPTQRSTLGDRAFPVAADGRRTSLSNLFMIRLQWPSFSESWRHI